MAFAWFMYTIIIMLVAIAAAASSVTVWSLTSRRDCLATAAIFVIYALETAGVLFDEYIQAKPVMGELFETGLTHPVTNIVLGVALVTWVWIWVALRVYAKVTRKRVLLGVGLYALVCVALAPVGSRASVPLTMAFWALRDVSITGALVFAWWWRSKRASDAERLSIDRAKGPWKTALVLSCLVLIEDVLSILVLNPNLQDGWTYEFFWHLTERNITDNVLMVYFAVLMLRHNREVMSIFSRHPMESATAEQGDQQQSVPADFDSRLLRFADDHGMSKREREVMALAVNGSDIQGIASELYISTGTVKAHLHRIYSKAGVENKQGLVTAFWKY